MPARDWTPERDKLLRQFRADRLSMSEVGLRLGISKGAIEWRIKVLQLPIDRPPGNTWPAEKDARLIELWADKTLSASEIGGRMGGLTKNAILGRVHRLRLPPRPSPIR